MVPVAFTAWVAIGSASDRGTDGRAARWTTASAPSNCLARRSGSRIEPTTSSTSVEAFQVLPTARGQVVDHDHSLDGWFCQEHSAQVCADKTCTAGHDHLHSQLPDSRVRIKHGWVDSPIMIQLSTFQLRVGRWSGPVAGSSVSKTQSA